MGKTYLLKKWLALSKESTDTFFLSGTAFLKDMFQTRKKIICLEKKK